MKVLVTRPAREAARTARRLEALGHTALIEPLLRIVPSAPIEIPSDTVALAATSANAFEAASSTPATSVLPVFCVGDRTAEAARLAGFQFIESADGDVAELTQLILRRLDPDAGPLLYLAGRERTGALEMNLIRLGFDAGVLETYRSDMIQTFSNDTLHALRDMSIDAVLLFSTRTAKAFSALVDSAGFQPSLGHVRLVCLSDAVAQPLIGLGGQILVSPLPTEAALLDTLSADA
jgi:uroporphyrinogen-III synthase